MKRDIVSHSRHHVRVCLMVMTLAVMTVLAPLAARAAPFAAFVMDARTGEVLYANNADTRLHPASLTKMLTLYITFQAIERGEISLDTMVKVSANAANEPPSKLGLKAGQRIQLRYLIRAAAVKSANDCATAIGEAVGGSEAEFAKRMNRTAKQLGMTNSTFKNANGLTAKGHMSTAHDMTVLGRHLFYDFPQYYNIFSRRTTDAGMAEVANTNRRFLDAYKGADGIKTGYTNPAGFNLTASAERNGVRLVATVLGGTSTAQRNAKMAELLDLGFKKAPRNAPVKAPSEPAYVAPEAVKPQPESEPEAEPLVAEAPQASESGQGKTLRTASGVNSSPRPQARPQAAEVPDALIASIQQGVAGALAEAGASVPEEVVVAAKPVAVEPPVEKVMAEAVDAPESAAPETETLVAVAAPAVAPVVVASASAPKPRPAVFLDAATEPEVAEAAPEEVVARISTSGGRHWGINVGRFNTRGSAERALLKTQLAESATLNDSLRKVVQRGGGYDANFMGLSQEQADLACRRLQARAVQCFTIGP